MGDSAKIIICHAFFFPCITQYCTYIQYCINILDLERSENVLIFVDALMILSLQKHHLNIGK